MVLVMLMFALGQAGAAAPQAPAGPAAGDREAVLAVVQSFFDTMAAGDAAAARRVLLPEGRFVSVRQAEEGPVSRTQTVEKYLAGLSTQKQKLRERMWNPEVRIHGAIAV